jgi:adenylate cyclase
MTYRTNWAALLIGLLVLLAAAAVMTLNLVGLTGGIHGFEFQTFQRLFPAVTGVSPPAALIATTNANIAAAPWLPNALALWPQLLFALAAGLAIVAMLSRNRTVLAALFTVLAIAAALAVDWLLFTRTHMFVPVLAACFVLALTFALGLLAAGLQPATRERLARVTPNEVPAAAVDAPAVADVVDAHGQRRTVSCLFCRIGALDELAGTLEPDALVGLAHETMRPFREAVAACEGEVLVSSAGSFVAVWNALRDDADHAAHACDAALRISAALRETQDQHGEGTPYERLHLEIGIATGSAILSGDGSQRSPWVIFGDCRSRAEQLSTLCGRYGAVILIDKATRDAVDATFAVLEVDGIAATAGPATIYALYGNPVVRASPRFRALSACNDHLFRAVRERRWADARTVAQQCRELPGAIPSLYALQQARLDWYEQYPPPSDWDGIFRPPIV